MRISLPLSFLWTVLRFINSCRTVQVLEMLQRKSSVALVSDAGSFKPMPFYLSQ